MRLVTWNCARGFAKKADRLFDLDPDVAVIQECSSAFARQLRFDGYRAHWIGDNPSIGMAVFYKQNWTVEPIADWTTAPRWVLPYRVAGPEVFTLIAVWTCEIPGSKVESYIGQIRRACIEHPEWFARDDVIIAGDFNSNACFDRERPSWNHSTMVEEFRSRGLVSYYHLLNSQRHGAEEHPTFHLTRNIEKPYHLDYIFAPEKWRSRAQFELGDCRTWLQFSDHSPLTLDLSPR